MQSIEEFYKKAQGFPLGGFAVESKQEEKWSWLQTSVSLGDETESKSIEFSNNFEIEVENQTNL